MFRIKRSPGALDENREKSIKWRSRLCPAVDLHKGTLSLGSGLPSRCCKAVWLPIVTCLSEVCHLQYSGISAECQRRRPPYTDRALSELTESTKFGQACHGRQQRDLNPD
jgi:hypothetical protein